MGWNDCHLHSFTIHGTDFGVPIPTGGADRISSRAHVGASSRESVELIDGGPDRGPLDRLVSKHLKQTGTSGFFERH